MDSSRRLSLLFFLASIVPAVFLLLFILLYGNRNVTHAEGTVLELEHSSLLSIVDCEGYSVVDVANPWGEGLLQRYILVQKTESLPSNLPEGTVVHVPVERMLVFSGVHVSLFEELGAAGAIKAVCDARYVYSEHTASAIACGMVVDCGSSLDVNLEQVAMASPEVALVLPYKNGGYGKIERVGIPLVECADYMEASPLACAEWVRFYGRLVGKGAVADSIFKSVKSEYDALSFLAAREKKHPKLMCELKSSSAWYVPAGESTMGRMYSDAGADYLFSSYKGTGAVSLSFETVLEHAAEADIWLMKYNSPVDKTYSSLLAEFGGYDSFRPYREKNIYVCNTSEKRIFEESSFHPELLLKELVGLFHPHLFPEYKLRYYERMR